MTEHPAPDDSSTPELNPYRFLRQLAEPDADEVRDWIDSLDALTEARGTSRARRVLLQVLGRAGELRIDVPAVGVTDYINTIPADEEAAYPGDEAIERRIRHFIRWNAAVMVARANRRVDGIGGHLATYASAATLYEVGFNHFFHGKADDGFGDQVFIQGHASPGIYARAFLEGRLGEGDLDGFRREASAGLPSYPHPRRSDFWEFPTVSMGLGLINAAYQARFNRYLQDRGIVDTSSAKVWCFAGDGEMDEPESLAALAMAGRERLDNPIFVVNCNLQRLDGPVRGDAKVIQELEGLFRGAGWNVIKLIWGREWDDLLARDTEGVLVERMNAAVDGEFQKYRVESGAYLRERFFGPDARLTTLVEHLTDDDLTRLRWGGHDPRKVHAAYQAATDHRGAPTVVLAKTVKGWALGPDFEARNATHQIKKMTLAELETFRDRLELPIADAELAHDVPPFAHPGFDSDEYHYLMAQRQALGGDLPARVVRARALGLPADEPYRELLAGTGDKVAASTTSAFTRLLRNLLRDPKVGCHVVPIVPDEARRHRGPHNLAGEGLQHCDGHSLAWASVMPHCRAYDPAFAYEVAVIIREGMRRMHGPDPEDVFYYVTLYNETYPMPAQPDGAEHGILRGLYRYRPALAERTYHVQSSRPAPRCKPPSKPSASSPTSTT